MKGQTEVLEPSLPNLNLRLLTLCSQALGSGETHPAKSARCQGSGQLRAVGGSQQGTQSGVCDLLG